ncbi:MAG TPA: outer membrane beta-barrel protein [Bacteroidota bacterium]|nr:outer membrane beta-barrel protein [Bacteroidota bacterium]
MKILTRAFPTVLFLLATSQLIFAQDLTLRGRSGLELSFGFWGGSNASKTITSSGVQQEAVSSGFTGSMLYSYGMREHLAITLSIGFLGGKASSTMSPTEFHQQASTVVPVLVGVRYYIAEPTPDDMVRLFLAASVGSFVGLEATNAELRQEARSESTFGTHVGAGIDFFLSTHFKLLATAGYNLMSDFKTPVGARANYNGGYLSAGFGYVF